MAKKPNMWKKAAVTAFFNKVLCRYLSAKRLFPKCFLQTAFRFIIFLYALHQKVISTFLSVLKLSAQLLSRKCWKTEEIESNPVENSLVAWMTYQRRLKKSGFFNAEATMRYRRNSDESFMILIQTLKNIIVFNVLFLKHWWFLENSLMILRRNIDVKLMKHWQLRCKIWKTLKCIMC